MSLLQGCGVQALANFGVPFYLCTNPLTTKFNVVTDMGSELVSMCQPRLRPKLPTYAQMV